MAAIKDLYAPVRFFRLLGQRKSDIGKGETFDQAFNRKAEQRAQCIGGVDNCGILNLEDQTTGLMVEITVVDGVLSIDTTPDDGNPAVPVVPVVDDEDSGAEGGAGSGFAEFYALMPGDNAATVGLGDFVEFPNDGPESGDGIVRSSAGEFVLPAIGTYQVSYNVSVSEAGQLVIALDGVEIPRTVNGRATGTSLINDTRLITTTAINQVLSIQNPAANSTALTVTPIAGGAGAVSASLVIIRLA